MSEKKPKTLTIGFVKSKLIKKNPWKMDLQSGNRNIWKINNSNELEKPVTLIMAE
jgi:hypothetical protein